MDINKVLLVDDDADLRRIGEISLTSVGKWQVLLAATGSQALQIALEERPDVILLDIMMPVMDGLTTFDELRQHPCTKNIPVIFLTAKAQAGDLAQYITIGAAGVITKPFDPMMLPTEVQKLVECPGKVS